MLQAFLVPRMPHRILGSGVACATVGLRPAAAPAAETFPEPVLVHLLVRLLAGSLAHLKDLCEMVP